MNMPKQIVKAFLFWLVAMAVGIITYMVYLGPPGSQFMQIALLMIPVVVSIIYFLFRATKLGMNTAMVLAVLWLFAPSTLFTLMPSADGRLIMLVLLAISVSLNLALSVVLKRKALH